jgi:hypothetical protein
MRHWIFAALWACPLPSFAADGCEDVWFTRNLVMDRAGYCFSSTLGQELFDNSDCVGRSVQPDPYGQQIVQQILAIERQHGCRVDTNRVWLDLPDIAFRRVLRTHPIRDEFESACLGWTGEVTPLYDGFSEPFRQIGQITAGDVVSFSHIPVAEWTYVTTHTQGFGALKSAGWLYVTGELPCADFAG